MDPGDTVKVPISLLGVELYLNLTGLIPISWTVLDAIFPSVMCQLQQTRFYYLLADDQQRAGPVLQLPGECGDGERVVDKVRGEIDDMLRKADLREMFQRRENVRQMQEHRRMHRNQREALQVSARACNRLQHS